MPRKSPQAARKQVEDVREELRASFPVWQSTVADVEDVLDQYKLSKRPEDLKALIASETDIHDYNAELQEYFKEDIDIQQKIEDVATRLSTVTEEGIEIIRQELDVTDPQAEEVKDALREMLMQCPLASLEIDEDKHFGADFHEATERHIQELSDAIKNLTGEMMRERDQMLADLREELRIDDFHEKFRAYCRLAEIKVEEAHGVCDSLQQERDQLQTRKSGLKRSLKDERKKIADRDTTIQKLIDQRESQQDGTKEQLKVKDTLLVDLRELNHLRKESIETLEAQLTDTKAANDKLLAVKDNALAKMSASLDEKNAKIQGLESKARAFEANQKQSEATIARQAQELTNAREDATAAIGTLDADNQHLESTVTELNDTVKSLQDQLSAATVANGVKDAKIAQLEDSKKNRRSQLFDKDVDIANLRVAVQASSTGTETAHQIYQPTESLKHGLEVAVRMITVLISDNDGIKAGDDIQAVMGQKCINLPIDDTVVDNVALPSLRFSHVAQKSAINHALCFWMAVFSGHNSVEVVRHAQGVFENFKEVGRMKRWTYDAIQELIHRLKTTGDDTMNRIMWIIAMQGLQMISSLVPGTSALEDLAVDVKAAVDNTSSAGLQYMIRQLLSSLADAQVNGKFAWLSGYPAGADVLDHSNSALAQGTKLIAEAPDLFFFVSTGGLAIFTADDVETVAWDNRVVRGWEIKLNFKADASVKLDPIVVLRNAYSGPAFDWVDKFLPSKRVIHSRFDT
ncbi:MAG: hypothetical protein Q9185_006478 [Variospora sp. 1 TL-2023]